MLERPRTFLRGSGRSDAAHPHRECTGKKTRKHGADRKRVDLADMDAAGASQPEAWLLLDDALSCLDREDPNAATVAKLRLFAGLSIEEAGQALNLSRATAFRHWTYARAWLNARLSDEGESNES